MASLMLRQFYKFILVSLWINAMCFLPAVYANTKNNNLSSENHRNLYLYAKTAFLRPQTSLDLNRAINDEDYQISFSTLLGKNDNRFQLLMKKARVDRETGTDGNIDFFYWRLIHSFWAIKGGGNLVFDSGESPYLQPGIGIEGSLFFLINADLRMYIRKGSYKFDFDFNRTARIYNKLFLNITLRSIWATKKIISDTVGSGLNEIELSVQPYYVLSHWLSIYLKYEYDQYVGNTKTMVRASGDVSSNNDIRIGFVLSF
jgi:uncharacterized protein involved in copper resistance